MPARLFVIAAVWLVAGLLWPAAAGAKLTEQQKKRIEAAAPDKPRAAPKAKRRVLIWNTPPEMMDKNPHKGYSVPQSAYAMKRLGEKTGAFEGVVSGDVTLYLPEKLKQFDAVVMNNSSGNWIRPADESIGRFKAYGGDRDAVEKVLRKSLLDFVRGGKGVFAFHFSIGANPKWAEFHEMLGARYWGHPWHEEVGIKVEEPSHPLLAAFGGKAGFRLKEEIFQFRDPWSREKLRVLLSLDTANTNMGVKWIHRKDNDFGLAWVKRYGKGRVFYSAIGHRTEIWWNPTILRFYLDGIQFAIGDLEAPTAPRKDAKAPDRPAPDEQEPAKA